MTFLSFIQEDQTLVEFIKQIFRSDFYLRKRIQRSQWQASSCERVTIIVFVGKNFNM